MIWLVILIVFGLGVVAGFLGAVFLFGTETEAEIHNFRTAARVADHNPKEK